MNGCTISGEGGIGLWIVSFGYRGGGPSTMDATDGILPPINATGAPKSKFDLSKINVLCKRSILMTCVEFFITSPTFKLVQWTYN